MKKGLESRNNEHREVPCHGTALFAEPWYSRAKPVSSLCKKRGAEHPLGGTVGPHGGWMRVGSPRDLCWGSSLVRQAGPGGFPSLFFIFKRKIKSQISQGCHLNFSEECHTLSHMKVHLALQGTCLRLRYRLAQLGLLPAMRLLSRAPQVRLLG